VDKDVLDGSFTVGSQALGGFPKPDEKLQDLELVLRALIGLCAHHDCGGPAALSDEYRPADGRLAVVPRGVERDPLPS